jgi:hypothetical protein
MIGAGLGSNFGLKSHNTIARKSKPFHGWTRNWGSTTWDFDSAKLSLPPAD